MTDHHFSQVTTRITRIVRRRYPYSRRRRALREGPMLRRKGGGWHIVQAEVPPPGVWLLGSFVTVRSWVAVRTTLAAYPHLDGDGVRATSSVQVRTCTGSFWPFVSPFFRPPRLFIGRLSRQSRRLTHPFRGKYSVNPCPWWFTAGRAGVGSACGEDRERSS